MVPNGNFITWPYWNAKSVYINFPTRGENLRESYFAHFFDDENKLKILSEIKPPLLKYTYAA